MTNADPVDKDRLDFTQCNDEFYSRCLLCTALFVLRQCKIYKNFPSLWWHIKRDHTDLSPAEREEIIQILNHIFKAFKRQMFPKWAYSEAITTTKVPTTSSSILLDGRPPRIDAWTKIFEIAKLLKTQSELYPFFKTRHLNAVLKVVLGSVDPRTTKKYLDCVTKYSKKDIVKGEYDVTGFCDKVGV